MNRAWILAALGACEEPPPVTVLAVEVAGCRQMSAGPTCHFSSPDLTLWVPGPDAPVASLDGVALRTTWAENDDGWTAPVSVEGGEWLAVATPTAGYRLALRPEPEPASIAEVQALARAEAGTDGGTPADRPSLRRLRAAMDDASVLEGMELAWLAHTLGDPAWSYDAIERAAIAQQAWWWAARAAVMGAHLASLEARDPSAARAAIARARQHQRAAGGSLGFRLDYALDFEDGLAEAAAGHLRRAIAAFDRAQLRAARLGRTVERSHARVEESEVLLQAGAASRAFALLQGERDALTESDDPCRRATIANSEAWAVIQSQEAGSPDGDRDPRGLLEDALTWATSTAPCGAEFQERGRDRLIAQIRLNRAIVGLRFEGPGGARRELVEALHAAPELQDPWATEIAARIALVDGEGSEALRLSRELAARPELAWRWRGLRGVALALQGQHQPAAAIEALRAAQALFFEAGLQVPLQLGRSAFYAQRDEVTSWLAAELLAQGRTREAFDAYRDQGAQYLAHLQQFARLNADGDAPTEFWEALARYDDVRAAQARLAEEIRGAASGVDPATAQGWAADGQALRERAHAAIDDGNAALSIQVSRSRRRPSPGELLIGWYPAAKGWLGFAEDADGIEVAVHPGAEPPANEALVAPFAGKIGRAARVTLVPHRSLQARDLHVALLDGEPLAGQVPVRFGLDLAPPRRSARAAAAEALLVTVDATGRSVNAFRAFDRTVDTLQDRGWRVQSLLRAAVTRPALLPALPTVDLFEYFGHAVARTEWGSALELTDGELDVGDVLTLARVPRLVVLSACGTGREPDASALGIAQAFVTAGSEGVVATGRDVSDALVADFAEALHAAFSPEVDLETAYRTAMITLSTRQPDADWAAFRLFVP